MPTLPLLTEPKFPNGTHRVAAPGGYEGWHYTASSDNGELHVVAAMHDLTLAGHPEVIALGDMVRVRDANGEAQTLPGVAPVAIQQGHYAGRLVHERLSGSATPPFHYRDKGNLATIGRARAVADLHLIRVNGALAWLIWLFVHLWYLIGFQNRLLVLIRWAFSFITRGRGARLITRSEG